MSRTRKRRKLKAEINVVPYIDVMLVLLIIFMVTAPLLNLGVDVDLPKSKAHSLDQRNEAIVVKAERDGTYRLQLTNSQPGRSPASTAPEEQVSLDDLSARVRAFHDQNPDAPVFLAADGGLEYQKVMDVMSLLQQAGVPKVALMSRAAPAPPAKAGRH